MLYDVHTRLQNLLHNRQDDMLEPGRRYLREPSTKSMAKGVYFILEACGFNMIHSSLRNITCMAFDVSLKGSREQLRPVRSLILQSRLLRNVKLAVTPESVSIVANGDVLPRRYSVRHNERDLHDLVFWIHQRKQKARRTELLKGRVNKRRRHRAAGDPV